MAGRKRWPNAEWGVPDWRDSKAYHPYADMDLEPIRWQFLRRHSAYREAWLASEEDNMLRLATDWKTLYGTTAGYSPKDGSSFEFALRPFIPAFDLDKDGQVDSMTRSFLDDARYTRDIIITWNPNLSIEMNVIQIVKSLKVGENEFGIRLKKSRIMRFDYPKYLQIIDARDAGMSYDEICDSKIFKAPNLKTLSIDALHKLHRRARDTQAEFTGLDLGVR